VHPQRVDSNVPRAPHPSALTAQEMGVDDAAVSAMTTAFFRKIDGILNVGNKGWKKELHRSRMETGGVGGGGGVGE
jgi:hypothetical protein